MRTLLLIFFLFLYMGAFAQPTAGLIAHWDMNGTANDVSGNGFNGHMSNVSPAVGKDGIMGHAYSFNGVNSYITIPYAPALNVTHFTIAAVVEVNGYYGGTCHGNLIFCRGGTAPSANGIYYLSMNDYNTGSACSSPVDTSTECFHALANSTNSALQPPSINAWDYTPHIVSHHWYNVVATFNDTAYKVYVNNVLMSNVTITTPGVPMGSSTDSASIGYNFFEAATGYPYGFNGIIDDIRIYNRALDSSEVAQLNDTVNTATLNAISYWDNAGTCVFDSVQDTYINIPVTFEIDSNGMAIDTINATSGFYYPHGGHLGDIYTFRVIAVPPGIMLTCPASGVFYDTITSIANNYPVRQLGFVCTSVTAYDLGINADFIAGRHLAHASVLVTDPYCDPVSATLTMNFSPKYDFLYAVPAPTSVSGNMLTWNFPTMSAFSGTLVDVRFNVPGTWLTPGDTVRSSYSITPTMGDSHIANNTVVLVDTVTGSYDPNEMSVTPQGYIAASTQLQYTINFENTGNDTAFNITVVDTLSDNIDARTMEIVAASAAMKVEPFSANGRNIVKLVFPDINLLDSSHHGKCDGMVQFTAKVKDGLADGTQIFNTAGIYFDYNPAVNTNTVLNIIGIAPIQVPVYSTGGIHLFPNPANSILNITTANNNNTVIVTNLLGQELISDTYKTNKMQVNISGLPAGIYLVKINGTDIRKFVKE